MHALANNAKYKLKLCNQMLVDRFGCCASIERADVLWVDKGTVPKYAQN